MVAQVKYISFLTRSDKRKDRVEIAVESLHLAALEAEEYSKKTGKEMMVVGWVN
jgi:BRCA1/BRCA2-containing complex subunit 3